MKCSTSLAVRVPAGTEDHPVLSDLPDIFRLIAIMLGRLEMDVDECISEYTELIQTIFDEKSRRLPISWKGMTKAQFDSTRLESAVKKVITKQGVSETGLFNDGTARGCKV